jgi:hypothetical protein
MLSVKRVFTAECCKYDEFKEILVKFSNGRSATVIAFYLLASLQIHSFFGGWDHQYNR